MFRTSNPALRNDAFAPAQTWDDLEAQGRGGFNEAPDVVASRPVASNTMTLNGTVNKSFFCLALCVVTATVTWTIAGRGNEGLAYMMAMGGGLAAFIVGIITAFKPNASPVTAPLYAALEGLFVGGISAIFAGWASSKTGGAKLDGAMVFNAVVLTFGIAGGVLAGYKFGLIRPSRGFYNFVIAATLGLCFYGLIAFMMAMFGNTSLASVYSPRNGGMISLGFSAFVILLASANLVLDFDMVANGVRSKAPKYMEWYGAYAILVTLVWLYIEVLRLLSKLRSND